MKPWPYIIASALSLLLGFGIHAKFFPCPTADPMVDALAKEAGKRIHEAKAYADTVLIEIETPGRPVYIRVNEREKHLLTASDDTLLARLDRGITAER